MRIQEILSVEDTADKWPREGLLDRIYRAVFVAPFAFGNFLAIDSDIAGSFDADTYL